MVFEPSPQIIAFPSPLFCFLDLFGHPHQFVVCFAILINLINPIPASSLDKVRQTSSFIGAFSSKLGSLWLLLNDTINPPIGAATAAAAAANSSTLLAKYKMY